MINATQNVSKVSITATQSGVSVKLQPVIVQNSEAQTYTVDGGEII